MAFIRGIFNRDCADHNLLKMIRSFGFLNMEKGPWAAGGAVRRIIQGDNSDTFGDVDVFCQDGDQFFKAHSALKYRGDWSENRARNADSFCFRMKTQKTYHDVQVFKDRRFATVEELLLDFDFTVCMAATDGWSWIADERFFRDLATKELVLNNKNRSDNNLLRVEKYCGYGFTPNPEVLNVFAGLEDNSIEELLAPSGFFKMSNGY